MKSLDETTKSILKRLVQNELQNAFESSDDSNDSKKEESSRNPPGHGVTTKPAKGGKPTDWSDNGKRFQDDPSEKVLKRKMHGPHINQYDQGKEGQPKDESVASDSAKKLGLTLVSFGMYADKDGKITHRTVDGKLVPVKNEKGRAAASQITPDRSKSKFGYTEFSKTKQKELLKNIYAQLKKGKRVVIIPGEDNYKFFYEPSGDDFGPDMKIG